VFTLDHLVKERYPAFIDAIRDVDDPLCTLSLFAALPSNILNIKSIMPEVDKRRAELCVRLMKEFTNYVYHARALRKVFVSIKVRSAAGAL
jgi:pescadillo protein